MRESDINVLCRLCLNKSFFYSNIFIAQALEGIPFYEDINYVYDLQISLEDGSPEFVCQKCFEDVNDFKLCKINAHSVKSRLFHLKSKLNIGENSVYRRTNDEEDVPEVGQNTTGVQEYASDEVDGNSESVGCDVEERGSSSVNEIFIKEEPIDIAGPTLDDGTIAENDPELPESQECVHEEEDLKPEIVIHEVPLVDGENHCGNEVMGEGTVAEQKSMPKISTRGSRKRRKKTCQMTGCCSYEGTLNPMISKTPYGVVESVPCLNGNAQGIRGPFDGSEGTYICSMCSMAFPNKVALMQHLYTHSEGGFVCGECSIAFPNKVALTQHLSMHSEGTYVCGECSIAFPNKVALTQHLTSHSAGTFVCGECSLVFPNKIALTQHHCAYCEGTFTCEECTMSFPNKVSLTQHLCRKRGFRNVLQHETDIVRWKLVKKYPVPRVLDEGDEYRCEYCGRCFAERATLLKHEMSHYEGKEYICGLCGKQFLRLKNLRRHEMVHKVDRPHKCKDCDKRFQDSSSLRRHEKIHIGVRPFHCAHCSKEFFRNDHLISHMRVHLNERPFRCDLCGKGFTERSTLRRHQRLHHPAPFVTNGVPSHNNVVPTMPIVQEILKSEPSGSLSALP